MLNIPLNLTLHIHLVIFSIKNFIPMKIKNCKTKLDEEVKLIKVVDGLFFYDVDKEPLKLDNDHIMKIGENFYKLKDIKKMVDECETQLFYNLKP
jgi:hypothetical protein